MKRTIVLLLYAFIVTFAQAQETNKITLKAFIVDKANQQPIENVIVFLQENNHIGKLIDSTGVFSLSFDSSFLNDTLLVSVLGYQQMLIPLKDISYTDIPFKIELSPNAIILKDFIVEGKKIEILPILEKTFDLFGTNYPNRAHMLDGYYRSLFTEGDKITKVTEADFSLQDAGYKKPAKDNVKIKLNEIRKTTDSGNIDSTAIRFFNRVSTVREAPVNPIQNIYERNYIRLFNNPSTVFGSFKNIGNEKFEILEFNDSICHISYPTLWGSTSIKIDLRDYVILEFRRFQYNQEHLMNDVEVKFQKVEGRYYPKSIKSVSPRFINRNSDDDEMEIHYMEFPNVHTDDFKKIKFKEITPRDNSLPELPYNSGFWESYPILLPDWVKESLKNKQPLGQQFIKKSSN